MADVFLDGLLDSLKVLAVLVPVYILVAFIEPKLTVKSVFNNKKMAPLIGVGFGLIPQCGFSVVTTDMYKKRKITAGTLLGVYLATSDEALPILLANPDKILSTLPLIGIKLVVGIAAGYLIDFVFIRNQSIDINEADITTRKDEEHAEHNDHDEYHDHHDMAEIGCCGHHIGNPQSKNAKIDQYLWHPLLHSLKIFGYIFVINIIFGTVIYYVGEENISEFLLSNRYLAPFLAVLVGLIPNCASSVIITDLYIMGNLGFGACVGGLCANAGLGLTVLFKDKNRIKDSLKIFLALILISLVVGYIVSAILNFA